MNIGFIGTDYKRVPLKEMETVYLKQETWQGFTQAIRNDSPIHELVILATCNRFELYFTAEDIEVATQWIMSYLAGTGEIPPQLVSDIMYPLYNENVITHLFNVSAGVESMVFGEDEILSQVKKAYSDFQELETTGPLTNKLFQMAIGVGKRARHETGISRGAYSVSSIAIDAMKEIILDYFGKSILIIGGGTIGMRAIKKLNAMGHPNVTITNRTEKTALKIATTHELFYLPFTDLATKLGNYDIILVATSSPEYIVVPSHFTAGSITELVIDLSVPRNVDPDVETSTRRVIPVDGLKLIADRNVLKRRKEFIKVQLILDEEKDKLLRWIEHRSLSAHSS